MAYPNYCDKLTKVTFPKNWNFIEGRISGLFQGSGKLKEIVNFETINFGSSVTNISLMFRGCQSLTTPVLSKAFQSILKKDNLVDITQLIGGCTSLTDIDFIKNLNTSKVTNIAGIFEGLRVTTIDISNWDKTNIKNASKVFKDCINLTNVMGLENLITSKTSTLRQMFWGANSLTKLDLSSWDVSNVHDFYGVLSPNNLTDINIDGWQINPDKDFDIGYLLPLSLINLSAKNTLINLEGWATLNMTNYKNMTPDSWVEFFTALPTLTKPQAINVGSEILSKLTSNQIAIATNKGWTVS